MASSPARLIPVAQLIVACALWGGATVISKALLSSVPPVPLLALQLAPSAAVLWLAVVLTKSAAPPRALIAPIALLGALNPGLSYTLVLFGLSTVSASVVTLMWATEPVLIFGLAVLWLREPASGRMIAILAVGLAGVVLVTNVTGGGRVIAADGLGLMLVLAAVLCCAFYTVLSRKISDSVDPLFTVAIQQTAGLAWAALLWIALSAFGEPGQLSVLTPATLAAAALSGLLYYAAAYWLYLSALRSVPASMAGAYFNLIPAFGVTMAFAFLGESLAWVQWVGAALILVSALTLVRSMTGREGHG